jgi:hypothetical protein
MQQAADNAAYDDSGSIDNCSYHNYLTCLLFRQAIRLHLPCWPHSK